MCAAHSIKVPTQYRATAKILRIAQEKRKSVKALILEEKHARKRSLLAVLTQYSANREAIDSAIEETELLKDNPRLDDALCKVLVTELIFGRKQLNGESRPVQTVRAYRERLEQAVAGAANPLKKREPQPRYVRINTNLLSIADALEYLAKMEWRRKVLAPVTDLSYNDFLDGVRSLEEDEFLVDMHVSTLLIFHAKQAHYWASHEYVLNKKFLLQNKATCLAAELLSPPSGATVLDMCAAPGMKTVHLCNAMQNKGCLYAVELNVDRFKTLCQQVEQAGCEMVTTINADALTIDANRCPDVEYILVDPSCSGNGMQSRINLCDEVKDAKRLRKLGGLQIKILTHAMRSFPKVKRIAYCTCSLWPEENEQVVQRCLQKNPDFKMLSCKKALRNKWQNVGDKEYKSIGKNCLYALPEQDITDGIFLALFERLREDKE